MYSNFILFFLFIGVLLCITKPLGNYIYKIYHNERTIIDYIAKPIERLYAKILRVNLYKEQRANEYLISVLLFSLISFIFVFIILLIQGELPLNSSNISGMSWDQALNTAISFITNTNWQSYSGETGVSYFSQMIALSVQNFLSAAVGISVVIALIRGITRFESKTIGNFWNDMSKALFWLLIPLSILIGVVYIFQGVPQNLLSYMHIHTFAGGDQTIIQGPIASQEAIKSLGTNGGGYFNANSAHPFENPTFITNFIQVISILAIPAALTYTFGKWANNIRQGWFVFFIMLFLFSISLLIMTFSELSSLHSYEYKGVSDMYGQVHHLSNMEGKELRFGIFNSTLYDTVSTVASDGGVNSVVDSYTPIGGMMALINMALGEVIFGGVGAGLYGFLMFVILSVFIDSLMIGHIPTYLGKRIQSMQMKWIMLALLVSPCCVLTLTAVACIYPGIKGLLSNAGAHGFSEILYAYTSAANNNGSAFAGLNANIPFLNVTLGVAMLLGRFITIIAVLMLAGSLVTNKKYVSGVSYNSLSTTSWIFGVLVIFSILIMGGLTIFPALAIGPILDHLILISSI